MRQCKHCGCTDINACLGGCCWITEDCCSRCAVQHAGELLVPMLPPELVNLIGEMSIEEAAEILGYEARQRIEDAAVHDAIGDLRARIAGGLMR